MSLRDNFQYNGPNGATKEFVETVNQISRLLNGMQLDFGTNGGTDIARVQQEGGLKIDLTRLYIPPPPP